MRLISIVSPLGREICSFPCGPGGGSTNVQSADELLAIAVREEEPQTSRCWVPVYEACPAGLSMRVVVQLEAVFASASGGGKEWDVQPLGDSGLHQVLKVYVRPPALERAPSTAVPGQTPSSASVPGQTALPATCGQLSKEEKHDLTYPARREATVLILATWPRVLDKGHPLEHQADTALC